MNSEWQEFGIELRVFVKLMLSSLAEFAFLTPWVLVQGVANIVIGSIELTGVDKWMLHVFQLLFAISTLVPVTAHIYVNIKVSLFQARERLRNEMKQQALEMLKQTHPEK